MVVKMGISLSEWVVDDIVGRPKNKSQRIEELLIKGYMAEKLKKVQSLQDKNIKKAFSATSPRDLIYNHFQEAIGHPMQLAITGGKE